MMLVLFVSMCKCAIFGYYNAYIPAGNKEHALRIIEEQLAELRNSRLLESSEKVFVNVIGPLLPSELNLQLGEPNIVANYIHSGGEEITLNQIVQNCAEKLDLLYYIHSKGSYTQSQENNIFRSALMKAVVTNWKQCTSSITSDNSDVCGLRFSPFPHAHFAGNFWWTHCKHVARLAPPNAFENFFANRRSRLQRL